jgi:hypothetical protein
MEIDERKLAPDLYRWVQVDVPDEHTVILQLAFSKDPEEAVEELNDLGMVMQSKGQNVIVATSGRQPIMQASLLPWVIKIYSPKQLSMKSSLQPKI